MNMPTPKPSAGAIQPAESVQRMFDDIAPRYDILNHVLSAGIDPNLVVADRTPFPPHSGSPGRPHRRPVLRHRRHVPRSQPASPEGDFHRLPHGR